MRKVLFLCMLSISSMTIFASGSVILEGTSYDVDTLRHVKVGPGTMQTTMEFSSSTKKFQVFVLTMEMKNHDNVEYRMEIGNDTTLTTERISSIANRKTDSDTHYFAGVNADFFITTSYVAQYAGEPHMDCIMNGEIASTGYLDAANYGHFFMDENKNMWCDNPTQSFEITYPDGTVVKMPRINEDIHDGETVMFNSKYGKQTRVSGTTNVQVRLADGESWAVNKPIKLIVVSEPTENITAINEGEAVLSALGSDADKISSLKIGEELIANFNIQLQDYCVSPNIKECSGGDVVILKRGEIIYEAHRFINAIDADNPRTMLGYNEDRSLMIWGLVDGRSSISKGCTYPEGAGIMKFVGCYDALNVDGGGSSGMYINAFGIINNPSDGSERAVGNGLFAVLNAPKDDEISEIRFVDWKLTFPKYGIYTPIIYGYNKYGLLVNTDVQGIKLSCSEGLGEIIKDGTAFYGSGEGEGELIAKFNDIEATVPVSIETANSPELKYTDVLIDNYRKWPIEVQALVHQNYMSIDPQALSWQSEDISIAEVDNQGILKGVSDGTTTITGNVGDFSGSINLTVECPTSQLMPIEKTVDAEAWTAGTTVIGVKDCSVTAIEGTGMSINYTLDSGRSRSISLTRSDLKLWSLPDAIKFTINPGTAKISTLKITAKANNGVAKEYIISSVPQDAETEYEIPISAFGDVNDIGIYPIWINGMNITLSGGTSGTTNSIQFPKFDAVYNNVPSGIEEITVDNSEATGPAIYYNLQGMKITNPESGLYIVKRGGKVTKEFIK